MGTATAGLPNSWKVVALYQGHLPLDANIAEGRCPLSVCLQYKAHPQTMGRPGRHRSSIDQTLPIRVHFCFQILEGHMPVPDFWPNIKAVNRRMEKTSSAP